MVPLFDLDALIRCFLRANRSYFTGREMRNC